jgi:hypothetical protein
LFWQLARLAISRDRPKAGRSIDANIPMMAIDTNNSINVKPLLFMKFSAPDENALQELSREIRIMQIPISSTHLEKLAFGQ